MPIVNDSEITPRVEVPVVVEIAAPEFRGVTVDTKYVPAASLLTHVQGSSWTVNYFSQVLNTDNQVQPQQQGLDPVYQQYTLIRGLELRVTQPATSSQDPTTQALSVRGAANVYPFLKPNVGDMFLADVGDGREGVFQVTKSERRSMFKDAVHEIEYLLIDYSTPERVGDLQNKAVKTLQYVRNFLEYGQNPLLELDEFEVVRRLADRYQEICQSYFSSYVSKELRTLVLPAQETAVYDHFMARRVLSLFSTWDADEIRNCRLMNVDDDPVMRAYTLWDLLAERKPQRRSMACQKMGLVSNRQFTREPMIEGIYWSGLAKVVYPVTSTVSLGFEQAPVCKPPLEAVIQTNGTEITDLAQLLGNDVQLTDLPYDDAPLIHVVNQAGFYVLSEAFYTKAATGQSKLELAVHDYLDGKALNNTLLLALAESFHAWGSVERFYYLPIVLLLIKASIRSV